MIDAQQRKQMAAGMTLVAKYKGTAYECTVTENEEGKLRYRLADGQEFKSPSAAGSAVMGGVACNGWRFWSIQGGEQAASDEDGSDSSDGASTRTGPGRCTCEQCGKAFMSDQQLAHHQANAERLCQPVA